jgi:hypothetical protein
MRFENHTADYYSDYNANTFLTITCLQRKITKEFVDVDLLNATIFWFTNVARRTFNLTLFQFHDKLQQTAILHSEQMKVHNFFRDGRCDYLFRVPEKPSYATGNFYIYVLVTYLLLNWIEQRMSCSI